MTYSILAVALAPTALAVRLLLCIHITAGSVALLAGLVPMLGRKGGPAHRRAGRLYVACMVAVAATAGLLCVVQPLTQGRLCLTGIAVLSFYLSFTGWRAAVRRSAVLPAGERVLAGGSLLVGGAMVGVGIWLGVVLFAFFGGLLCLFAGLDTWRAWHPTIPVTGPAAWLVRHFTRLGGSYISAFTAFVVVNLGRWLPAGAPGWLGLAGWIAPTIIGTALIFRAVARYRVTAATIALALALLAGGSPRLACAQVAPLLAGELTDAAGQPLPYATVGVVGQPVGTVADEHGRFQLRLPATVASTDSVRFALLGYRPRTLAVAALPTSPLRLALSVTAVALAEVTVRPGRLDTVYVGNPHYRTRLQTNFALGSQPGQNVGSEIGRVFQLPGKGAWLDEFEFVLSANDFDTVRFRLNVYCLRGGVPAAPLLRQPIYQQLVGKGARRVRISLAPELLLVTEDAVAVTLEWVGHSRQGSHLALPLLMPAFATHLYRYGAANRWKRFPSMSTTMRLRVLAQR